MLKTQQREHQKAQRHQGAQAGRERRAAPGLTIWEDYRGKWRTLTVWVALAELLTEILRHDAGAGAVTGAVWMVTGLVVVHLCGRVI